MARTSTQIEQQIFQLEKKFSETPQKILVNGKVKYNNVYYSLKNKLIQLEKELKVAKSFEFLAR